MVRERRDDIEQFHRIMKPGAIYPGTRAGRTRLSALPDRGLNRRAFMQKGALVMLGAWAGAEAWAAGKLSFQVGLLTDVHYADRESNGTRFYRESLAKMHEAIGKFNEIKPVFLIHLGDLIDAAETVEGEIGHLKTIEQELSQFTGKRHYVLGNHCVFSLTKEEYFANSAAQKAPYSFDHAGFHFVILDACYRPDEVAYGRKNFKWNEAELPAAQREWLRADLRKTAHKTVVCVHQRLDVENNYGIKSGPQVRKILEESGQVLAVFQGHSHKNDYHEINGIHYCTAAAMIEGSGEANNAYGLLSVYEDGTLKLEGFKQQKNYEWHVKG